MPYKRKYKKRYSKGVKAIASLALRTAMRNKKAMEIKSTATSFSETVNSVGNIQLISAIPEGTDYDDRVGKKVSLRSFQIQGLHINNDTTLGVPTFIRLMVVRDNSFSGSAPAISDILLTSQTYSVRNPRPDLMKKYTVLYDYRSWNERENSGKIFSKYRKIRGQSVFDGSGLNDVNKGALYVVVFSNRSTDLPTVSFQTMVKYVDA